MSPRNLADAVYDLRRGAFNWRAAVREAPVYQNAIQAVGEGLENIVKDILAGVTLPALAGLDAAAARAERQRILGEHLVWQGAPNNPPDAMFREGGDAIEIKRHRGLQGALQLNSSWPRSRIDAADPRLHPLSVTCEPWQWRHFVYAIGDVAWGRDFGNQLWLVDGGAVAKPPAHYAQLDAAISHSIESAIRGIGLIPAVTNELGAIGDLDHRGARLRIRGMWQLRHPAVTFQGRFPVQNPANAHAVVQVVMVRERWEALLSTREQMVTDDLDQHLETSEWTHAFNDGTEIDLCAFGFAVP